MEVGEGGKKMRKRCEGRCRRGRVRGERGRGGLRKGIDRRERDEDLKYLSPFFCFCLVHFLSFCRKTNEDVNEKEKETVRGEEDSPGDG